MGVSMDGYYEGEESMDGPCYLEEDTEESLSMSGPPGPQGEPGPPGVSFSIEEINKLIETKANELIDKRQDDLKPKYTPTEIKRIQLHDFEL